MKIGITYDMRDDYLTEGYSAEETAEFDHPLTIAAIEGTLGELGYRTERIGHIRALAARLVAGDRWDLVFNIAEGLRGFGREAQVPALLEAYDIPYTFSDPLVLALTLHKGLTKRVIRDLGIPTPDFAVVETPEQIAALALPFPLFAKPVAEGTGKGITAASRIDGPGDLERICRQLLATYRQPVLVETYLPGREFTVGVIGTGELARPLGVMEVTLSHGAEPGAYSYSNKANFESLVEYLPVEGPVAEEAARLAVDVWRGLACRDGGRVDIRLDAEGRANFLEVNPLAGLNPKISDLPILCSMNGVSYQDLLRMIVQSALERLPMDPDKERAARG